MTSPQQGGLVLMSMVYVSTATSAITDETLAELLKKSRARNRLLQLTGMLLHKNGRFLQVLEGPEVAVRQRMAVIGEDSRHHHVSTLIAEPIRVRQFPDWSMAYEPLTGQATRVPVFRHTFTDLETRKHRSTSTVALRELISWFHDRSPVTTTT